MACTMSSSPCASVSFLGKEDGRSGPPQGCRRSEPAEVLALGDLSDQLFGGSGKVHTPLLEVSQVSLHLQIIAEHTLLGDTFLWGCGGSLCLLPAPSTAAG